MKNKLFSGKVYIETLRRLRIPAIVLIGICWSVTMVTNLIELIELNRNAYSIKSFVQETANDYAGLATVLWGFVYIAPIVLVFGAFHFLNSRNSSDFYHGLPHTRPASFLSMFAAAMTIQVGGVVSTILIDILGKLILIGNTGVRLNLLGFVNSGICFTLICLILSAGIALGMSLTGTFVSNMVVSVLILYFPRIILTILFAIGSDAAPVMIMDHMGILFDIKYNLIFSPFGFMTYGKELFSYQPSILYSLFLGLALTGLALLAYVKRKSETADRSASSNLMRRIYSLVLIVPMALGVAAAALTRSGAEPSLIITLIVMDLILFLVYETVTTKGIKSFFRGLPAFIAVIVGAIIVSAGVRGVFIARMNDIPDADNVRSICLEEGYSFYGSSTYGYNDYYYTNRSYVEAKLVRTQILDRDSVEAAVKALERDVKKINNNDVSYSRREICYTLKNGSKMYRQVSDLYLDTFKFGEKLVGSEEARNLRGTLPGEDEVRYCVLMKSDIYSYNMESEDLFWDGFREQLEKLTPEQIAEISSESAFGEDLIEAVRIIGTVNGIDFENMYYIYPSYSELADFIVKCTNERARTENKVNNIFLPGTKKGLNIDVTWYQKDEKVGRYLSDGVGFSWNDYDDLEEGSYKKNVLDELLEALKGKLDKDPSFTEDDIVLKIQVSRYVSYDDYDDGDKYAEALASYDGQLYYTLYVKCDSELADFFGKYMSQSYNTED